MDKVIVFDTETTGFEEPRLVEAAYIVLSDAFEIQESFDMRYNPHKEISYGAMATHHIVPSDLVDCPPYTDFALPPDVTYIIGHQVDYDWEVIGKPALNALGDPIKRICTLALARHLLPDVDSHKQSALMYYYFGDKARDRVRYAHSALSDVSMCVDILKKVTLEAFMILPSPWTWDDLWQLSEIARIPNKMTFGKHDGELISEIPLSYCYWLKAQDWLDPYLRIAIERRLRK